MKLTFGDLESKRYHADSAKREKSVILALIAIRQLGFPARRCEIPGCDKFPWEAEENTFPCQHLRLYDLSLRGFGLDVLNEAARRWIAEGK